MYAYIQSSAGTPLDPKVCLRLETGETWSYVVSCWVIITRHPRFSLSHALRSRQLYSVPYAYSVPNTTTQYTLESQFSLFLSLCLSLFRSLSFHVSFCVSTPLFLVYHYMSATTYTKPRQEYSLPCNTNTKVSPKSRPTHSRSRYWRAMTSTSNAS